MATQFFEGEDAMSVDPAGRAAAVASSIFLPADSGLN